MANLESNSLSMEQALPVRRLVELVQYSAFFDPQFYLDTNSDVRQAGCEPALHYILHGGFEGRNPGPWFSTEDYLRRNPDVAQANWNALVHYELYGRIEGNRLFRQRPAMRVEFRVPISPTPQFYSTVRLAALSLRSLGPPYDSARIVVSVGDYADVDTVRAANAWSEDFPIEWRAVSHEFFRKYSYVGTATDRFLAASEADVIVLCDADVCLIDRIDDLINRVGHRGRRRIAGLPAHFSPFISRSAADNDAAWRRLFANAGLPEPSLTTRYSGDAADVMGRAPAYFNFGMVAFNREALTAVAPLSEYYTHIAWELMIGNFFSAQAAVSLLVVAAELEIETVSFAYNCSNDELPFIAPDEYRIDSADDIRVIHYLRTDQFDRRNFLVESSAYDAFLSAENFNCVNTRLRDHILKLSRHDDVLFPLMTASAGS